MFPPRTPSAMAESKKLHIVMFPWLAFGHIIPFLELAKLISQKGHRVSFISTPRNIDRLPNLPKNLLSLITFVKLPFSVKENLPPNAEATIDVPFNEVPHLKKAHDGLKEPLASYLETYKPDWIIYDFSPYWLPPIAAELGISGAFFNIVSARSICFFGSSTAALLNGEDPRSEAEHFTVPPPWIPFQTTVAFHLHEAKGFLPAFEVNPSGVTDLFRLGSAIGGCDVIISRSSLELESEWLNLIGELHQKPVLPVGMLPPVMQATTEQDDDGSWLTIKTWLDKQSNESVVYLAFGGEATLSQEDLAELAHGLELSGLPFLWALRLQHGLKLPEGFEDRTQAQGLIWKRWVPQVKILGHESVGCFLNHCGWSSIAEGLLFGRPLIMLPIFLDQGLTARAFEQKQVGMEIPRNEEDGSFTSNSVAETIKMVMMEEKGKTLMENAKKMKKVIGDKELNDKYIDDLVTYLQSHKRTKMR